MLLAAVSHGSQEARRYQEPPPPPPPPPPEKPPPLEKPLPPDPPGVEVSVPTLLLEKPVMAIANASLVNGC
ncbi:MAG: hypothetical protein AB7G21_13070 [Dehalococcoidia bacterium]